MGPTGCLSISVDSPDLVSHIDLLMKCTVPHNNRGVWRCGLSLTVHSVVFAYIDNTSWQELGEKRVRTSE